MFQSIGNHTLGNYVEGQANFSRSDASCHALYSCLVDTLLDLDCIHQASSYCFRYMFVLSSIISPPPPPPPPPPQTCLVFLCGGCRTQSSMSLVSTSTVTSTHHMLRPLQNGVVGNKLQCKLFSTYVMHDRHCKVRHCIIMYS